MKNIKNIFCIGRNYAAHVEELGNQLPAEPVVFTKPTHALTQAEGQRIALPKDRGAVHYEVELVVKMGRDYAPNLSINELISEMTIGLDLTLRDVQSSLKAKQEPWDLAKAFPHAAIIGEFIAFPGETACKSSVFSLEINGQQVQVGNLEYMIFPLASIVSFIGDHIGLKKDDIIFTGTPEGVGPLSDGDKCILRWDQKVMGSCLIEK